MTPQVVGVEHETLFFGMNGISFAITGWIRLIGIWLPTNAVLGTFLPTEPVASPVAIVDRVGRVAEIAAELQLRRYRNDSRVRSARVISFVISEVEQLVFNDAAA